MTRPLPPAQLARERAGITLSAAARRARVSERYLRGVERNGAEYALAVRLAGIYGCRIELFLGRGDARTSPDPVTAGRRYTTTKQKPRCRV